MGILQQISTFPSSIYILNKYPRQSWPKDCSPAVYQTFSGVTSPIQFKTSPGESNPVPSGKLGSISPSSKLIPSRFWKLIPRRTRTRLPDLFKELFPYQDITGLSSAKSHGKVVVNTVLSYPQQVIINNSAKYLSPHRVLLPSKITRVLFSPQNNPFAKFIPQRSHLLIPVFLQLSSPAE